MKNHPAFDNVIGQKRAINLLSMSAYAHHDRKELLSILIQGEKGLGKTHLARAYCNALTTENPDFKVFDLQPRDIRLIGDKYNELIERIISGEPYILFLDECHELATDNVKQCKILFNFLRRALDGNNRNTVIPIDGDQYTIFDRRKHVIILATNYPNLLDKSQALQSRFTTVSLEQYNEDELFNIASYMAETKNVVFKSNEPYDSLKLIARCGRGSARFLEKVMEQLHLMPDTLLTNNHVVIALRNENKFPRGLDNVEIKLLKMAKSPISNREFMVVSNISSVKMKDAIAYLLHLKFIKTLPNSTIQMTDRGKTYLSKCLELGFEIFDK